MATPSFVEGCFSRNLEGDLDEHRDFAFRPEQLSFCARSRASDAAELGEKRMPPPGSEQPAERLRIFGERFAIVLDRSDREHAIDEILRSSPRADTAGVGESGRSLEHLVREDGRSTARW